MGTSKFPNHPAWMPGVGGILFLLRGSSISLCATFKLARVGFSQCVPPSSPEFYSMGQCPSSLFWEAFAYFFHFGSVSEHPFCARQSARVPTFLRGGTTPLGWPDLRHPMSHPGIAPSISRLRVCPVRFVRLWLASLPSRIRTYYNALYRRAPLPSGLRE